MSQFKSPQGFRISFSTPIGFPRGYAIGIPSILGFPRLSWVFRGTMVHGFSKASFEFRSISFPRTLSYLLKLSSILFSQSVCLTQNVVLSVRLPVRLWAPIRLYTMPHYALRCYTRTLIMVLINFWGDSDLF